MSQFFQRARARLRYELGMIIRKNDITYSQKAGRKILLIGYYDPKGIATILQTIYEYCNLSRFSVDVLNIAGGHGSISTKNITHYSAIIIHNTASYNIKKLKRLHKRILSKYHGIKVIMKQDEHFMTKSFVDFLDVYKYDLLLTLWDVPTAKRVYQKDEKNRDLLIMNYLTGYVPEKYCTVDIELDNREIDIGYRGSVQPTFYGRFAHDKSEIGDKFLPYAIHAGLKCDISSRAEDRFMGNSWLDFLKRCKAVLGVEGGSEIVDYTGEVQKQHSKFLREHPKATEGEILDFMEQFRGEITYRVISPRLLEAAACGALQILYEGEYQGILKPYVHYVPLKRDYSNIEEVIDYIKDDVKRKKIVTQAREDLIMSRKYSFQQFTTELDERIEKLIEDRGEN